MEADLIDRPLRIGLVGASWFALRAHVPALLRLEPRGCRLVAVCSRTRKSAARAEAKVLSSIPDREMRRHQKMEQMFADPEVDAVLLVLPIPLMTAAIELALRAGKHVLSEKPMAPSVKDALRLLGVIRELGESAPSWYVLENWSVSKAAVRWLRERMQEGAIGRLISAHCATLTAQPVVEYLAIAPNVCRAGWSTLACTGHVRSGPFLASRSSALLTSRRLILRARPPPILQAVA